MTTKIPPLLALVVVLGFWQPVFADTTINVDGDSSDWPNDGFEYLDPSGDTLPWRDITSVMATDDNSSGSDGNLYLGITFRSRFLPSVVGIDIDVFVYLDVDGDGQIAGPNDRIVELTEGTVSDGDGATIGSIGQMAYSKNFMEASIPYSVLGLSHGSDVFGISTSTVGFPGLDDNAPAPDQGDGGFIIYDGTQEPEPKSVLFAGMEARCCEHGVEISWRTGSERANVGFFVYRQDHTDKLHRLTSRPIPGLGDSPQGKSYSFLDTHGKAGDRYFVQDLQINKKATMHGPTVASVNASRQPKGRKSFHKASSSRIPTARIPVLNIQHPAIPGSPARLAVSSPGINIIPRSLLDSLALEADSIAIMRSGHKVPSLIGKSGLFFIGIPKMDRYADYEVITAQRGYPGIMRQGRVQACSNPMGSVRKKIHLAQDHVYYIASPVEDHFFWAQAFNGLPAQIQFHLPSMLASPAQLQISMAGMAPEHRVEILLNGSLLAEHRWQGQGMEKVHLQIPQDLLTASENLLQVELTQDSDLDLIFVEGIDATYEMNLQLEAKHLDFMADAGDCLQLGGFLPDDDILLMDVSDPQEPVVLSGYARKNSEIVFSDTSQDAKAGKRHYSLVVMDSESLPSPRYLRKYSNKPVLSVDQGARYLIVTHPDFMQAAGLLARYHRAQGMSVAVVSTEQLYDRYGDGRPSPESIRAFIMEARHEFHPHPDYVLLIGSATVDSNGHLDPNNFDHLPAPFINGSWGYEGAWDGWYVRSDDGPWPAEAIGRLAVKSPQEAIALANKIISYSPVGGHPTRLAMVADDYDPSGPGKTQEFEQEIKKLRSSCIPVGTDTSMIFKRQSLDPRAALLQAIDSGIDALIFDGHAYLSGWSSSPVLFDSSASHELQNNDLFVLLSFTCFDGAFVGPWAESLAWSLVSNPRGGALAAISSSSLSAPEPLAEFATMLSCVLASGQTQTLGEALTITKRNLWGLWPSLDKLMTRYNFLGDPATANPWYR